MPTVVPALWIQRTLVAADPGITPNQNGLPGLTVLKQIVGALLTWGLIACVAGLVVSVIIWALGHHGGNYSHTTTGKTGVLVSAAGALLIGGANAIVSFFSALGSHMGAEQMPALPDIPLPDLSLCGGPLQPVCDTLGGVTQSLTQTTADLVLGSLGDSFVSAADQVSQTALQALDATTSVRLTTSWFQANLGVLAAVALPIVVGLFVLQVMTAVLRREPGGLARAVVGVGKAMLGAALAVAVTQSALVACDQVCEAIAGAAGTSVTGAARRFVDLSWLAGPQAGPVLQILLSLAMIVGFLLLWAVMLFRKAALFLVVVFAPIAFAGTVFDHTRSWTRRWIEAVAALVLCKLVVVVVFVVGASAFSATGPTAAPPTPAAGAPAAGTPAGGGSLSDTLAGALLLSIAVLAPWMTYRFLHWTGSEAAVMFHSHLAGSPVPQALRGTARQVQAGGQRAVTAALLTSGAGAPLAVAGTAAGRRPAGPSPTAGPVASRPAPPSRPAGSAVPRQHQPATAAESRSR